MTMEEERVNVSIAVFLNVYLRLSYLIYNLDLQEKERFTRSVFPFSVFQELLWKFLIL